MDARYNLFYSFHKPTQKFLLDYTTGRGLRCNICKETFFVRENKLLHTFVWVVCVETGLPDIKV